MLYATTSRDGLGVNVPASQRGRPPLTDPQFRFVDVFAGIGGIRAGLEHAGGRCDFTVEKDEAAVATYEANWGLVNERDIISVQPIDLPPHEILAAGFPCQPFSLAGVSRKNWANRAHGFNDEISGNLFFQIVKLIGGNCQPHVGPDETRELRPEEEVDLFQSDRPRWDSAPPVLLLENVRHLVSHDQRRTFRVIRRRLMQAGYWVSHDVINGSVWVPQNRRRTIIVCLRTDMFPAGPFEFRSPGDEQQGPRLATILEPVTEEHERYRVTLGTWNALLRHRAKHEGRGTGFGFSVADPSGVTRTLSARYYKDGAEILVSMPSGERPRRLTPRECAKLMGFTKEHLGFEFEIPVSDRQAYKQFGNSVVVPQFNWIAHEILLRAEDVFARRIQRASENTASVLSKAVIVA